MKQVAATCRFAGWNVKLGGVRGAVGEGWGQSRMISAPASGRGPSRRPAAGVQDTGVKRLAPFGFALGQNHFPRKAGTETRCPDFPRLGVDKAVAHCFSSPTRVGEVAERSKADGAPPEAA